MPSSTRRLTLLGLLAIVLVGCGGAGQSPQTSGGAGQIVFTVNRDGWGEIWVMDENGEGRRRLTAPAPSRSAQASGNTGPSWSPARDRIAYIGTGDADVEDQNDQEQYVMDAAGGHVLRLTSNHLADGSPSWSPDRRRIVFARARHLGQEDVETFLYVMNADGSGERLLRRESPASTHGFLTLPTWSPDGERIAFVRLSYLEDRFESAVYVMGVDGTGALKIADEASEPAWSPDGSSLAFVSYGDRLGETCFHDCLPSTEIYVVEADGSHSKRLTRDAANDQSPAWSPDGKRIAFVSDRSNRNEHENEIYIVPVDGGTPERITHNSVWDLEPDWK